MYNDPWGNPITSDLGGNSVITVYEQCPVKGDLDCDGKVSDFELLDYVDKWVRNEVSDFDLLKAIDTWAKG